MQTAYQLQINRSQHPGGVRSSSSDMFQILDHILEKKFFFVIEIIFFVKISGISGFSRKISGFFPKHNPNRPKMKSGASEDMEMILDGEIICTRTLVLEISGIYS